MTNNIILFDGVCNFCNAGINFILDRDKKKIFLFASLQSDAGKKLLEQFNNPSGKDLDSVIFIKDNKIYRKSGAVLEIAKNLGGMWPAFYVFKVIPVFIRDFFYDLVAKSRYSLFGKRESCRMPNPEIKSRFLG